MGPLQLPIVFSSPADAQSLIRELTTKDKRSMVTPISKDALLNYMQSIILHQNEEAPFYVLDLGVIVSIMEKWNQALPMIQPFYAVKCNPDTFLLQAMASLGSNFDCASQAEIESVIALGVSPDRIIFANPCKAKSHIKYAASVGVNLTTFDSREEVEKIKKYHPNCDLLIRIKAPGDSGAKWELGTKFGALPEEIEPMLKAAQAAGLNVTGVSFHIGSEAMHLSAFREAIAAAKQVFKTATRLGLPEMNILDVGGGFVAGPKFTEAAVVMKEAIQTYFPNEPGIKIIAEPGRLFAETAFTLATSIIGTRLRGALREYWINDGIYGCLNFIFQDRAFGYTSSRVVCTPLACVSNPENPPNVKATTYSSTVFGPTCDSIDTVFTDYQLPEMKESDWLVFENTGAYSVSCGSNFNGFRTSATLTYVVLSKKNGDGYFHVDA